MILSNPATEGRLVGNPRRTCLRGRGRQWSDGPARSPDHRRAQAERIAAQRLGSVGSSLYWRPLRTSANRIKTRQVINNKTVTLLGVADFLLKGAERNSRGEKGKDGDVEKEKQGRNEWRNVADRNARRKQIINRSSYEVAERKVKKVRRTTADVAKLSTTFTKESLSRDIPSCFRP